jgi:hypothetical protein
MPLATTEKSAVGSLNRRVGALEEYINTRVQQQMEAEIEALLDLLEHLTREEYMNVARVIMESGEGANGD